MIAYLLAATLAFNPMDAAKGKVKPTKDSIKVTATGIIVPGDVPWNGALALNDTVALRLYFPDSTAPKGIVKAEVTGYFTFYYMNPEIIVTSYKILGEASVTPAGNPNNQNNLTPKGLVQVWHEEGKVDTLYILPLKF